MKDGWDLRTRTKQFALRIVRLLTETNELIAICVTLVKNVKRRRS
jgi:hypothetical protein